MIRQGNSVFAPLSPERIEAAQERHGHAIQEYLKYLHTGDVLADDVVLCFERLPAGEGRKLLEQALNRGIDSLDDPPPELVALFGQVDHVPLWVDWERMKYGERQDIAQCIADHSLPQPLRLALWLSRNPEQAPRLYERTLGQRR